MKKFYDFEAEDDTGPDLSLKKLPGGSTGETNAVHSMSEHQTRNSHRYVHTVCKKEEPLSDN